LCTREDEDYGISLIMAKERLTTLDATQMLKLKRYNADKCKKCKVQLKIGDKVSFVRPFARHKYHSFAYHRDCWDAMQY